MKIIRFFLSENFPFLVVKFSMYWNSRVFVIVRLEKSEPTPQSDQDLFYSSTASTLAFAHIRNHSVFRSSFIMLT